MECEFTLSIGSLLEEPVINGETMKRLVRHALTGANGILQACGPQGKLNQGNDGNELAEPA